MTPFSKAQLSSQKDVWALHAHGSNSSTKRLKLLEKDGRVGRFLTGLVKVTPLLCLQEGRVGAARHGARPRGAQPVRRGTSPNRI